MAMWTVSPSTTRVTVASPGAVASWPKPGRHRPRPATTKAKRRTRVRDVRMPPPFHGDRRQARAVADSLRDRDLVGEIDVLDGAKEGDALVHRPLERLAPRDEAGPAGALVDDRGLDRLLEVGLARRGPATVDQRRPARVAVEDLVPAEVDRVVGAQLRVHGVVGLA